MNFVSRLVPDRFIPNRFLPGHKSDEQQEPKSTIEEIAAKKFTNDDEALATLNGLTKVVAPKMEQLVKEGLSGWKSTAKKICCLLMIGFAALLVAGLIASFVAAVSLTASPQLLAAFLIASGIGLIGFAFCTITNRILHYQQDKQLDAALDKYLEQDYKQDKQLDTELKKYLEENYQQDLHGLRVWYSELQERLKKAANETPEEQAARRIAKNTTETIQDIHELYGTLSEKLLSKKVRVRNHEPSWWG